MHHAQRWLSAVPSAPPTGGTIMDDDRILARWQSYLYATSSTERSVTTRLIAMRALLKRSTMTLQTMTRDDLIDDLGRELAPSTRVNYKSLYHTFFTWMQDEGYRIDNPGARLPGGKIVRQEPNPVSTEDIQTMLNSGIYRRARMWVLLYAYQGFRCVEIAAVRSDTIDWTRQRIKSVEAKGGHVVWRPLHPIVWAELQKWRHLIGHLFPSPTKPGKHVTANNVSRVLNDAFRRAGIDHTAHDFRAWFGTELIDAGTSTVVAAAAMRHRDMQSIDHYALVRIERIDEAQQLLPSVIVPERSGRKRAA